MLGLNPLHPSDSMPDTLLSSSLKEHCIMSLLYKPLSSTYFSVFTASKTKFAILFQIGFESVAGLRNEPKIVFCQMNLIYSKASNSTTSNNTAFNSTFFNWFQNSSNSKFFGTKKALSSHCRCFLDVLLASDISTLLKNIVFCSNQRQCCLRTYFTYISDTIVLIFIRKKYQKNKFNSS